MQFFLILFQSHLYGIESTVKNHIKSVYLSFNRTFMELKAASLAFR